MEERLYQLMHRDDPVCTVSIDPISGAMLRVSQKKESELLPPGGAIDTQMLRKWWQRRAVPIGQGRIRHILAQMGMATTQEFLVRNLGLSLTDHYWLKPLDMELCWENVSLFSNDFRDPVGSLQFEENTEPIDALETAFSPSSSAQGELRKKWIISDNGKRCLIKGNHGSHSQESLNEVAATLLHRRQGTQPYVSYRSIRMEGHPQFYCICESFTSEKVEFIPAIDVVESEKKDNSVSQYEHFIQVCAKHGLEEEKARPFLEYQILTDFILTNTDRHLNNFGVLRDSDTLQWIGMAPIFDSGNSMFWQDPKLPERTDLLDIPVNSFRQKEIELLDYVKNPGLIDLHQLPAPDDLYQLYATDPLIPCIDSVINGYTRKIALLEQRVHHR